MNLRISKMLPKEVLYAFYSPFRVFFTLLIGYVLGRMGIGFASSLTKLMMFLGMLLVVEIILQIILGKLRRERWRKKLRDKRRMRWAQQEFWIDGDETW